MRLNVLYQFNEKYVPYAGISMVSLMENNKKTEEIYIYVLGENLTEDSKKQLTMQVEQYGHQIHFMHTDALIEKMRMLGIPEYRGAYATNMKMFVTDYLNDDIDRLLYIDSDTIICGDVSSLIFLDMENKPIGMVLDSLGARHKLEIGLDKQDDYFNGGVILYDVRKWRQDKWTEKIREHVKNVRTCYMAPDQDILNIVLKNQIKKIDISFNLQPMHTVYSYRQYSRAFGPLQYYSEDEIRSAIDNPRILHFFRYLGEFPWHKSSLHPYVPHFDRYMALSLWKDYQKQPTEQNELIFKIERWLYKYLPRIIFLKVFKISYEIYIWKSNRDSFRKNIVK